MKGITYTSGLLAATIAAYCGGANAQQACQGDIQQLRTQLERQQLDEQMRREVEQLLNRATTADDRTCDGFVAAAERRLEQAQRSGSQQSARAQGAQPRQQPQQSQQRQQAQAEAQRSPEERTTDVQIQQAPADVAVDAGAPQVDVQQQPPEVTVEQPPPQVTITQPEPEVTVQQAEPQVSVRQGQPEVQVQQAEPQVQVRQGGEPEVRVVEPQSEREAQARSDQAQQGAQRQQSASGGQIDEARAAELVGSSIKTADGEEVGEVSAIARSRSDSELYAVTDVGGFFGIGERTVAMPLERANVDQDGNLVTEMSREELEQMREYDPQQFAAVR